MSKILKLFQYTCLMTLMGCGGENTKVASTSSAPKNPICTAAFQTANDACREVTLGPDEAFCMQKGRLAKNLCLAGEVSGKPDYIFTVEPAKIKTRDFSDFDFHNEGGTSEDELESIFENGTMVITSTGLAGNLGHGEIEAFIKGRSLVMAGPVNPVSNQNFYDEELFTLTAATGEKRTVLIKKSYANLGPQVLDESHYGESIGEEDIPLNLNVILEGLEPTGAIGQKDLTLTLDAETPILSDYFRAFIFGRNRDGLKVDTQEITSLVNLDEIKPKLTIDAASLQELLGQLPQGSGGLDFEVSHLENKNSIYHRTYSVFVSFYVGQTALTGQLVDADGAAVTPDISETGPLEILIEAVNSTYRNIVEVNTDGSFKVTNLPAGDSYWMTVSDLRFPNLFKDSRAISKNAAAASVDIYYAPKR